MQKDPSKGYLVFTKKEKRGTLVILVVVLLVFICSKYIYPLIIKDNVVSYNDIAAAAGALKEKQEEQKEKYYTYKNYGSNRSNSSYHKEEHNAAFTGIMFSFDPNTLDAAGWQRLGIKEKTIGTILNYLSKGGKFREADDIKKIWGLSDAEKVRLVPYVRIAAVTSSPAYANNYQTYEKKTYQKKIIESIDINSGDSAAYDELPGIGPGYAKRIVNFRNRLGGFYKTDQVAETFGLPDSVFQKIRPLLKISGGEVHKININTATNDELKAHPYIRWQLANMITEYKKQHGNFKTLTDLRKIIAIDEETYDKIVPYFTL